MKEFIIGGTRSGKSAFAQRRALESGLSVIYFATAQVGDAEMAERIARHRAERPADWGLVEEPLALADALKAHATPDRCLLIDCLTLWLSNLLAAGDERLNSETRNLLDILPALPGQVLLVSNEVGWGVVPLGAETRHFVDELGRLNQDVAAVCQRVSLVACGQPLLLKGQP